MREEGLILAIDAAGGVSALARGLGIAQPSVSSWHRIPAERVVAIEALTGVNRSSLRPDLFAGNGQSNARMNSIDDIGTLRAQEYLLLAALLRRPATAELLSKLAAITGDASPLGLAHIGLAEAAQSSNERAAGREFFNLFIGVGRGELLPYASFYLTGFLNERPLGRVREDLVKLGIERAEGNHDPEDHIATLLETMAGLANGDIAAEPDVEQAFFERHLKPWALRFFADLAVAPSSDFYRAVAGVGHAFLAIEAEAYTLPDQPARTH
jgi:TorA maturation chaperone TorD